MAKIAVITTDGGAGKTSLAFGLAKDLGYYLLSNDMSIVNKVYDKARIMEAIKMPIEDGIVYDFGGFFDAGVTEIIKDCDLVIVPCINDLNSKMKAIKTIEELQRYNDNFLVVATRVEDERDYKEIKEAIQSKLNFDVLRLRKTKLLKTGLECGLSPIELTNEDKLLKYNARGFLPEYQAILDYVQGAK